MPGDLLVVEICNLGPLKGDEWGFTGNSIDRAAVAFSHRNAWVRTFSCTPLV